MLNSYSLTKSKLNNLKYQLNDNEKKLKKTIFSKGKYLKNIDDGTKQLPAIGITGVANGLINHWDKFNSTQLKDYTIAIAKNSDRIISLVNNMLDFAYLSYENFNLNSAYVNLNQFIREKFQTHNEHEPIQNQINIVSDEKDDLVLSCDKYFINRLLDNLILYITHYGKINYVKSNIEQLPDSSDIVETENGVCFQIRINYTKIKILPLLFYKTLDDNIILQENNFENFKPQINEDINLILVRQIVKLHKGKIWIEKFDKKTESIIFMLPI